MAYVIVHYLPFLIAAGALGFAVGWWATGSRLRQMLDDIQGGDAP